MVSAHGITGMTPLFRRAPKDPNERVHALIDVLRQQHRENNRRGVGLTSMPKYARAKRDLADLGGGAVPALIGLLSASRPDRDTPEGDVEFAVAHDIAEVLGDIGDPRAIEPMMGQFKNYVVATHGALAKFPAGIDALLRGLDDDDDYVRGCCIQGLGLATVERVRAAHGLARALDDAHDENRREAALAAWRLGLGDPQLVAALQRHAEQDSNDRVRDKARDALRELTRA
jgi:HEAT repeat protein